MNLEPVLLKRVTRRNPFRPVHVPWLARLYRYPFDRWSSWGKQVLFGAPNLFLFSLLRRLSPVPVTGTFEYEYQGQSRTIRFDARNTQFQALYRKDFAQGYEPEVGALLDIIMPATGVFYDIGSNWGYFSLHVASRANFAGRIHAFEPFPSSHSDLVQVVSQAKLDQVIACHRLALSDAPGTAAMHLPDFTHSGQAILAPAGKFDGSGVAVQCLDQLPFDAPAVIKIDAEGSEAKILRGGKELIARHQPLIVFESWRRASDPDETLEPFRILEAGGYQFFQPCWHLAGNHGPPIFIPELPAVQPAEVLALVPLTAADRFLRNDQINVLACPMSRWSHLRALFSESLERRP